MKRDRLERLKRHIEDRWTTLEGKPFPNPSSNELLVEVKADLANICTFARGCVRAFIQRGRLERRQRAILLRCLDALEAVDGKLTIGTNNRDSLDGQEVDQLREYISDLQRLMESTLLGCFVEDQVGGEGPARKEGTGGSPGGIKRP
jgi:hypothetical protein